MSATASHLVGHDYLAEEKEELIGALSRSLDPVEVSNEWAAELEQRAAASRVARP